MLLKYLVCSAIFLLFGFCVFRVIVRRDYLKKSKLSALSYSLEVLIFVLHVNFMYLLRSSGLIPRPFRALFLSAAGQGFAKLFSKASLLETLPLAR
jgi:uncharacterized protein YybS (DUF2232 family)